MAFAGFSGAEIGERVKQLREAHGWSQRELADRTRRQGKKGVSHSYISHLEMGMYPRPGLDKLSKVAEALGTPLSTLTGVGMTENIPPVIIEFARELAVTEVNEYTDVITFARKYWGRVKQPGEGDTLPHVAEEPQEYKP